MADRTVLTEFRNTYEVKNGQIGSQDVLNKAVDKLKQEMDLLWNWSADTTDTLPSGTIANRLIDDIIDYTDVAGGSQLVTRSANYIGLRISNDPLNNGSQLDTWSTSQIFNQINNANLDGGTW